MKLNTLLLSACLIFISCDNEPLGSSSDINNNSPQIGNFVPRAGYWIYNVNNTSELDPNMNIVSTDSVYLDEDFENYFSLSANEDGFANGSMNSILTNGNLYDSQRKLVFDGSFTLPENIANLGLDNFTLSDVTLIDLDAENGDFMFFQSETITNTLDIQGTELPIELNYEIYTSKNNYHDSLNIDGDEYLNVFEGNFTFALSISGTFTLGGFPLTVSILEPQNIINTNYYYVKSIGLVRSESNQGFELSSELNTIFDLLGFPIDIPTSFNVQNIEQLIEFELDWFI